MFIVLSAQHTSKATLPKSRCPQREATRDMEGLWKQGKMKQLEQVNKQDKREM